MEAFIFDMDGVISDTQNLGAQKESELLRKYGIDLSADEITKNYAGVSDDEFFLKIFSDYGKKVDVEKIIKEKWEMFFEVIGGNIREIKGAKDFIKMVYGQGYKLALASASIRPFIDLVLHDLELSDYFSVKVSSTEVENGKPAPDVFLLAAKRLGVKAEDCIVIEDGINGMQAAKNARMKCIGLVADKHGEYPADILVNSFSEIDLKKLY